MKHGTNQHAKKVDLSREGSTFPGELVPLSEIAECLDMQKTHARRYALRHGFIFVEARISTNGGRQKVIALSKSETNRLIAMRKADGFPIKGEADEICPIVSAGTLAQLRARK
jgi:hypothetical protein